jgi:hypothetical protein
MGYRRIDTKGNTDIRQDLNIFNVEMEIKECQWNKLKNILRIATYRIPWKILD